MININYLILFIIWYSIYYSILSNIDNQLIPIIIIQIGVYLQLSILYFIISRNRTHNQLIE